MCQQQKLMAAAFACFSTAAVVVLFSEENINMNKKCEKKPTEKEKENTILADQAHTLF